MLRVWIIPDATMLLVLDDYCVGIQLARILTYSLY